MSGLKTLFVALMLAFAAPSAGFADRAPVSITEQAQLFAACAGRLYAEQEREWMADVPVSPRTSALYDQFVDLIEAVMPFAEGAGLEPSRVMAWRIDARMAHRALLTTAEYGTDPRRRAPAARRAATLIRNCEMLLPGA